MRFLNGVRRIIPVILALVSGVLAENYATWTSYKDVIVNTKASGAGVGTNVLNYPVLVRLDSTAAAVFSQAGANGASIRFAKPSGLARPYQIESWDSAGKTAAIWVLADTIKGNDSGAVLRMYWGNVGAADSSHGATVFDTANGYKGVFHLNEASGNIQNSTIDTITGLNVGTTTTVGVGGAGRNFAGTNAVNSNSTTNRQYINMGNPTPLAFNGRMTLSSWVRWVNVVGTGGTSVYRTIINRDGTAPSSETFLRIGQGSGNSLATSQYSTGKYTGSADILALSPQAASAYPDSAQWIHMAGAYDSTGATTRIWRLYRNGVQIGVSTDNATAAVTSGATLWRFGRGSASNNARWFSGDLDEIRISNVTRDSNFLLLDYQTQKPGSAVVLLGATQPAGPTAPTNLVYAPDTLRVNIGAAVNLVPTVSGAIDSFTVSPALPDSLKLNKTTGVITGTGRSLHALTTYIFRATNSLGFTTDTIRIAVIAAPPTNLVYPVQTASYLTGLDIPSNTPTFSGAVDSFTVSPALPTGILLNKTTGVISGRPTAVAAAANYILSAVNGAGTAKDTVGITVTAPSADGAYSTWSNHKVLVINAHVAAALQSVQKFPLLVRLDSTNFGSGFAQAAFGGTDIRFTKPGDVVRLPHQIESWDATAKRAAIWVLVDSVHGDNITNIRMHWGKSSVADSSKGAAVFDTTNGFGAVWHMNEPSGNVFDATGNAITGTNAGTTASTGIIGGARNFAGGNLANNTGTATQSITVGNPAGLDFGTNRRVTMEAWVRWSRVRPTAGTSFWRNVIMRLGGTVSNNDELHLRIDNTDPYQYRAGAWIGASDMGPLSLQSAAAYGDSLQWVHLVGVYDSSDAFSNVWRLYRNGVIVGEGVPGELGPTGMGSWFIGSYSGTSQRRFWAGDIDELRVSRTNRSASWVKLSYETQKAAQTAVSFSDTLANPLALGRTLEALVGGDFLSMRRAGENVLFRVQAGTAASFRLGIVDMKGREVWAREMRGAGDQTLLWDGITRSGKRASSGIYGIRVSLKDSEGRVTGTLERMLPLMP